MANQTTLKTYEEVLQELSTFDGERHLLLGNGFNLNLGIETDYKEIFLRMKKEYPIYNDIDIVEIMDNHGYDIEKLIGELKKKTEDRFLWDFIDNKVKYDFMRAAYSIVKDRIQNVYEKNHEEIYLLLEKFSNYFSLNYDPFLYLLLMRYDSGDDKKDLLAFQKDILFEKQDLDDNDNKIFSKIREAYYSGSLRVSVGGRDAPAKSLIKCNKTQFIVSVNIYFANENWSSKSIAKAYDLIIKERDGRRELGKINDGFVKRRSGEIVYKKSDQQNIFYLHGSFHIYRDEKLFKKFTQNPGKPLYERLEEVVNNGEKELTCVLRSTMEEKMQDIRNNSYLQSGHDKLTTLKGCLVILGSSLGNNDSHIFDAINNSDISVVYISTKGSKTNASLKKAKKIFHKKEVRLFDYTTIKFKSDV